jgi:hypothetical protein
LPVSKEKKKKRKKKKKKRKKRGKVKFINTADPPMKIFYNFKQAIINR